MRLTPPYEALLYDHFVRIASAGASTISVYDLLVWHDQERITVTIWRSIDEHWKEFLKNTKAVSAKARKTPLFVGDARKEAAAYTFIWGEGLAESERSWFKKLENKT